MSDRIKLEVVYNDKGEPSIRTENGSEIQRVKSITVHDEAQAPRLVTIELYVHEVVGGKRRGKTDD